MFKLSYKKGNSVQKCPAAYNKWNWENKYPVIRISFGSGSFKNLDDFQREVKRIFKLNNENFKLNAEIEDIEDTRGILYSLIEACYKKSKKKNCHSYR